MKRKNLKWPELTAQQKQRMLKLREEGWRPAKIAKRYGLPVRCVYHWTQDAAVTRGMKRMPIKVSDGTHPLVGRLYKEIMVGPPMYLVALESGHDARTIGKWFRGEISPRLKEIESAMGALGFEIKYEIVEKRPSARLSTLDYASPSSSEGCLRS